MGGQVLVALDLQMMSHEPLHYAMQLAGRIDSTLLLLAVSPPKATTVGEPARYLFQDPDSATRSWLDRIVAQCQDCGVKLEIFVASGPFQEELIRFVRSRSGIQFIVMRACALTRTEEGGVDASTLEHLRRQFDGEILFAEKAGRITQVSGEL